ncbi:MAG: hypothetical protein WBG70_15755 [Spirulinaceae cyanobacterium]
MKKVFLVGSLMLLLVGCGNKDSASNKSVSRVGTQKSEAAVESQDSQAVVNTKVELINPGAEPRQELRFAPKVNQEQTVQMNMQMEMSMSLAGQTQPAFKSPQMQMTVEAKVTDVDENGDIHVDFSYTDADVVADSNTSPEMAEAMRNQIKQMVGFKGSMIVDSMGNTKDVNFDLPESVDPNSKQMLEQMLNSLKQLSSPVPAQAVGEGAKWQVDNTLTANGITLDQVSTYEVESLQGDTVTLKTTVQQQADPQKVSPPGLPPNASINLQSLNSQGEGTFTIKLDQILPTSATMAITSDTQMAVKQPDSQEEIPMGMNMVMNMSLQGQ